MGYWRRLTSILSVKWSQAALVADERCYLVEAEAKRQVPCFDKEKQNK